MKASTKQFEIESQKMEKRLEQMKLALKKEKEERRRTTRWKSTEPGAPDVLRKAAQANAQLMTQKTTNLKWKILRDLKIQSKPSVATAISNIKKTVAGNRSMLIPTKPEASSIKSVSIPRQTTIKNQLRQHSTLCNGGVCDQCETRGAERRCIDCSLLYCGTCWHSFHSKGQLKNHRSQAVEAVQQESLPKAKTPQKNKTVTFDSKSDELLPSSKNSLDSDSSVHSIDETAKHNAATIISHSPKPSQPYLPPANSLLRGHYDEAESSRSFQEAVHLWRSSRVQADEKIAERNAQETGTQNAEAGIQKLEAVTQKESGKVDTSEISTATINRLPSVEIRFSDDNPWRYHEWLLSQQPKSTELNVDTNDTNDAYLVSFPPESSKNVQEILFPVEETSSERLATNILPSDKNEKAPQPVKCSVDVELTKPKGVRLNGLVDFDPICDVAAEAAKKRLTHYVVAKNRLTATPKAEESTSELPGVWELPTVECNNSVDTARPKTIVSSDIILKSGADVQVSVIETLLAPEPPTEESNDGEDNWVIFPVPTSSLEEMRQNHRHRPGTPGTVAVTSRTSLIRPENKGSTPPFVIIHGNTSDVFPTNRKVRSPMAPLLPSPSAKGANDMQPTIEITPLFGFESPNVKSSRSPMQRSSETSLSTSPSSLPSLSPNQLSPAPSFGGSSGGSRSPSPRVSRSPSPRRSSVSVNNESRSPQRSLSPFPPSVRPPSPRLQRSGYHYLRVSRMEKTKNRGGNKNSSNNTTSAQNGSSLLVDGNSVKAIAAGQSTLTDKPSEARIRDGGPRADLPRNASVTKEQMSVRSLPDSPTNTEVIKEEERTKKGFSEEKRPTGLTNGFEFKLGRDMWNPVESVLSPHFPDVEEKIKCIDFGIKDYLSAEMKDSDEESSGSGDFNNGLNVEPQTLRMETDTESPLFSLDDQDEEKKKALVKKHLGFLRGGSSNSNGQVDDTGPNDMSNVNEDQDEDYSNTESDGSFSPVDSTVGSLAERDAEDAETMDNLEEELGQLIGEEKVDTESIVNRLLRLNSRELAFMDPQQVDAALSIVEDVGQGSGLSSPMTDSDEDAKMVETLK